MGPSVYRTPAEPERVPRPRQSFGEVALVLLLGGVTIVGVHLVFHPERPSEPQGQLREARHTLERGYGSHYEPPPPFAMPAPNSAGGAAASQERRGPTGAAAGWGSGGEQERSGAMTPAVHNEVPYQAPALHVQAPPSHVEASHWTAPPSNNSSSYLSHGSSTNWFSPSGGHFGKGH
jgi:hypothetical protein